MRDIFYASAVGLMVVFFLSGCVAAGIPVAEKSGLATVSTAEPASPSPSPAPAEEDSPTAAMASASDFLATEILGRPTDTSVTVSVVPASALEIFYEFGTASGAYSSRTEPQLAEAGRPLETSIGGLRPDTRYYYRIRSGAAAGEEHSFMTRRAPGAAFSFGIQADSHLNTDKHCDPELYRLTLLNAVAGGLDFYIDLGDSFRTDKLDPITPESIERIYLDQRAYFGLLSHSAPLFLVNGNHEMEWGWLLDGTAENPAVWSANARNAYYPEPAPDGFYSGDTRTVEHVGLLRDYYAWTWGDALFVVIDPYWSTPVDPRRTRDNWDWTLGEAQYQWFRDTLEGSAAKYKFVFAHHLLGENRGGVEQASLFEWGGADRNGAWSFDVRRPGWEAPIHQLMVQNHVTVFFQGHDHLYAQQELDGVIYQTVPMPGDSGYETPNREAYPSGVIRPESGYLRVTVSPDRVTVEYIRSFLPRDETGEQWNGMTDTVYSIPAG